MFLLNILDNEVLHVVAEMAAIVIGSILMGILLAYLNWGSYKKKVGYLNNKLDFERNQVADLNLQINQLSSIRDHLAQELSDEKNKNSKQSKAIYDQSQQLYSYQALARENLSIVDTLNNEIKTYRDRLEVIESELLKSKEQVPVPKRANSITKARANYEHVSKLLGRQVTENDLTVITGIGPRTASLLQQAGITSWEALAKTSVENLKKILVEAGGIYKSQDPAQWPKQAFMAAQSEWRKLRIFQETLKNKE